MKKTILLMTFVIVAITMSSQNLLIKINNDFDIEKETPIFNTNEFLQDSSVYHVFILHSTGDTIAINLSYFDKKNVYDALLADMFDIEEEWFMYNGIRFEN